MADAARYSIIAAEFNQTLIHAMIAVAHEEFRTHNLTLSRVLRVPGCFELPLAADVELVKPEIAGLVVLGYIERGETQHGEVMGHVVYQSLVDLQIRVRKPIGLGIIGPGATPQQAQVRHIACAKAAVNALRQIAELLNGSS